MEIHSDDNGVGLWDRLRSRGFCPYFTSVAVLVFVLLTIFDFVLPYVYGLDQPGLNLDLMWDVGINIVISFVTAGFAWKYNGEPWINRPDTIKIDLNDQNQRADRHQESA